MRRLPAYCPGPRSHPTRRACLLLLALGLGLTAGYLVKWRVPYRVPGAPAGSLAPIARPRTAADEIVNGAKAEARRGVA
jgi:hypothetical protein